MQELPAMLLRQVQRDTPLVEGGHCAALIVYPHSDPAYAALANGLAQLIVRLTGCPPELAADERVIPARGGPLPEAYRARPLILLGNLNTNRLVTCLYARYFCATDALYPGGDGIDLRTLVNPYGRGCNLILAGGSSLAGVEKAVTRLGGHIQRLAHHGELALPYLIEVELEPGLARRLQEWPDALLDAAPPETADLPMYRAIGAYALAYNWSGDARYGNYARDCLRRLNSLVDDSYGDRHYYLERLLRAVLILSAGDFLDTADLLRTDQLLLNTVRGQQDMWWRKRDAQPPLGHRHHGKGTYEFYLIAQYLRWQARPNPAALALCDAWLAESRAFLDGLAEAGFDDQDDDTTLNNLATLFWYALGEERSAFFENGNARRAAERSVALHDNMGAGAGQSGYTEAYLNMLYIQLEATIPVAAAAFYYQDAGLKWILKKLPNLDVPIAGGRLFYYYPIFMHKFDTGAELAPEPPAALSGLRVLPLAPYQVSLNDHPPLHIESMGHFVNAPETWLLPEGIAPNRLPAESGFDKIVARPGYEPEDAYVLLQGYQGGFRWQGRNRGANCIVRFSQFGHIFLVQNTSRLSPYYLNGVHASDGYNREPAPPLAEWLAADDFPAAGLSSTRLAGYHGTEWTRHLLWHKAGAGFFVVIDCLRALADGPFSYTCTWRTPAYAVLEGHTWRSEQGQHCFRLCASEEVTTFTEIEDGQSAAAPYILHQVKSGQADTGMLTSFQNLFYARPKAEGLPLELRHISAARALVYGAQPVGLCAAGPEGAALEGSGLRLRAGFAWISPAEICLSGALQLEIAGLELRLESAAGLGISLDLNSGTLLLQPDGPGSAARMVSGASGGRAVQLELKAGQRAALALPVEGCRRLADGLAAWLGGMKGEAAAAKAAALPRPEGWREEWRFDGWSGMPERLRAVTVAAEPAPIDGFPEQLCDTVYPELRDASQQWPAASQYQITLSLAEKRELSRLRLVGDSPLEPFYKLFNALPAGIRVELSDEAAGEETWQVLDAQPVAGEALQRRFRGIEDRLETLDYAVQRAARRVRLTVPAPAAERMLVLNEVELYSDQLARPGLNFLIGVELEDGGHGAAAVSRGQEVVVLGMRGEVRWRRQLDSPVTHLSSQRLDGPDGPDDVCLGLLNGDVLIFSTGGELRRQIPLRAALAERQDAFFGWLDSPNTLQVWQRDAAGRAALAVGGYGMVVFLDPDGEIVGHSWADGPWVNSLLAVPGRAGADLWARTGWNHGLMVYRGQAGFAPSGERVTFGGVRQPMYRAIEQVIPFVNGKTTLFEQVSGAGGEAWIAAAAAEGFGVLAADRRAWLWKVEGGMPVSAGAVIRPEGQPPELVIGGADGFISAFALSDGQPLRRMYAGAPVSALSWSAGSGVLTAATRAGVLALDAAWKPRAFYPLESTHLCQVGERAILAGGKDGRLVALTLLSERGRD